MAKRLIDKANEAWADEIMIADFHPEQATRLNAIELLASEIDLYRKEEQK